MWSKEGVLIITESDVIRHDFAPLGMVWLTNDAVGRLKGSKEELEQFYRAQYPGKQLAFDYEHLVTTDMAVMDGLAYATHILGRPLWEGVAIYIGPQNL